MVRTKRSNLSVILGQRGAICLHGEDKEEQFVCIVRTKRNNLSAWGTGYEQKKQSIRTKMYRIYTG